MKKSKVGKLFAFVCALLSFVMVFSVAACNSGDDTDNTGGLSLNLTALTLDVGTKNSPILVTSTVTEDVVWTSSDSSKVSVEGSGNGKRAGLVTALAVGEATVTATSGDKSATCTVTVVEAEKITITKDGTAVSSNLTLSGKDATVQLAASSSRGHDVAWESDKPLIATVSENGLVTAVATNGSANILAKCAQHSDVVASVKVVVGDGKDASYELENTYLTNSVSGEHPGVWMYWNEFSNITEATYVEGEVSLTAINLKEGANWYNIHMLYTANEADKDEAGNALTAGQHYKTTFDLDSTMAGKVTVNGYVLDLEKGTHTYTVYYDHLDTALTLYWGVDGQGSDFVNDEEENQEITMKLSNIKWETSEKIQLKSPTFDITDNTLTINDPNTEGVGSYTLNLYRPDGKFILGIPVKAGKIDPATIPVGTFTGKLIAYAANAHYIDTPEITSANATITGTNENYMYTMNPSSGNGAVKEPGTWTYYVSSWVIFEGKGSIVDDSATISFSNNKGNWTDTQLFYKVPGKKTGDTYSVKLHIDNVPNAGRIQIGTQVVTLKEGNNEIPLSITESAGASITIVFGVYPEDEQQEIQSVENLKVRVELV